MLQHGRQLRVVAHLSYGCRHVDQLRVRKARSSRCHRYSTPVTDCHSTNGMTIRAAKKCQRHRRAYVCNTARRSVDSFMCPTATVAAHASLEVDPGVDLPWDRHARKGLAAASATAGHSTIGRESGGRWTANAIDQNGGGNPRRCDAVDRNIVDEMIQRAADIERQVDETGARQCKRTPWLVVTLMFRCGVRSQLRSAVRLVRNVFRPRRANRCLLQRRIARAHRHVQATIVR